MSKRELNVCDVLVIGVLESVGYGTDQETAYARLQGMSGEVTVTVPPEARSTSLVKGEEYTFEVALRPAAKGAYYLRAISVTEGVVLPDELAKLVAG